MNPFIPPPDGSSGPGVVVSQSYDAMQRELEAARKEKAAAEQKAADAEAARAKQAQELASVNAQFTQYKTQAESQNASTTSQLNFQLEAVTKKDAEIQRLKGESTSLTNERNEARRERDNKNTELDKVKTTVIDGMTDAEITIVTITYGSKIFYEVGWTGDNYGLVPKIHQLIRSGGSFHVNDPWFNNDPNPGLQKQCTITYRYNKPGLSRRIRTFVAKQYDTARFDSF